MTIEVGRDEFVVTKHGSIAWADEDGKPGSIVVTAKELDRIKQGADYHRKFKQPEFIANLREGYGVAFLTDDDTDGSAGDVQIGCKTITYETVKLAHRLSLKARGKAKP